MSETLTNEYTIDEFVDDVERTLQYWLDAHTCPEAWANSWLLDDDPHYTLKESPIISNSYFRFDLQRSALRSYAKRHREHWTRCKNCGSISEFGYCGCEKPEKQVRVSISELTETLIEFGYQDIVSNEDIVDAMETEGFKAYTNGIKGLIAPVVSEVKEVLKAIRRAKTNEDRLQAVLWGTRVYHVHGNIMNDYTSYAGVDYEQWKLIDQVRNDGLESVWSSEELKEFLEN